ncbi:MAG TPA: hypothetical protein VFV49_13890 [Thermoanaerobaculia bacterium]|nr:hypothetical protein [Thermoanaerobaculia bacterium]
MLLAEIVFASRILGLAAGEQNIAVQVDAEVRKVEVRHNGERVAVLREPPWRTVVDLGPELMPQELTAVAFDANGYERGRDTQVVNVAHPPAELGILLDRDAADHVTAGIRWSHFAHEDPIRLVVKLDGRTIGKGKVASKFPLGKVDASQIHVLGVEATFREGIRSRKEIVFGGGYSEQLPAELTPVVVRQRTKGPDAPASCFRSEERKLLRATIEQGSGAALFILNGGRGATSRNAMPEHREDPLYRIPNAEIRIVHPVAQLIQHPGGATRLFDSTVIDGVNGTNRLMKVARTPYGVARIADAIGSAALRALRGGQRRVIVLVIGHNPAEDHSINSPAVIRRYLERVGVPFRVWSLTGPRPDLADTWGEVHDVSTAANLIAATEDLRQDLDSQRLAWLPVAPLDAFKVSATEDCAYVPLAASVTPPSARAVGSSQ